MKVLDAESRGRTGADRPHLQRVVGPEQGIAFGLLVDHLLLEDADARAGGRQVLAEALRVTGVAMRGRIDVSGKVR